VRLYFNRGGLYAQAVIMGNDRMSIPPTSLQGFAAAV
jgi:hypothetical protein